MKKVLLATLLAISPIMVVNAMEEPPASLPETFSSFGTLLTFIQGLLNWFFVIIIIIAIFYLLYVGLRYVLSGGKKETVQGIGSALGYVLVGLVVAIIAKGLIYAVCTLFTASGCRIW